MLMPPCLFGVSFSILLFHFLCVFKFKMFFSWTVNSWWVWISFCFLTIVYISAFQFEHLVHLHLMQIRYILWFVSAVLLFVLLIRRNGYKEPCNTGVGLVADYLIKGFQNTSNTAFVFVKFKKKKIFLKASLYVVPKKPKCALHLGGWQGSVVVSLAETHCSSP